MALPSLLTRQEAADRARISTVTLRKLIQAGRGPNLTIIGGKSFILEGELGSWIAAQTQQRQIEDAAA